jgi:multidrug resistance efflux pump
MNTDLHRSIGGALVLFLTLGGLVAAAPPPEALERFRNLSPAERLRLLEKVPGLEKHLYTVKRDTVSATLLERGSVEPAGIADVACRVKSRGKSGPVSTIRWVIDDGTLVKQGDKLVELDDAALREQLQVQKVALEQALAAKAQAAENLALVRKDNDVELRLAEIAVKLAEVELKKASRPGPDRESLELKAEQARLLLERARAQAKARETQADLDLRGKSALADQEAARVRGIEEEVKQCTLTAPRDGLAVYSVSEQARLGAQRIVAQGEPVHEGQKLLRVCDLTRMLIIARVHEALVSRVRPGQRASVRVDAFPDRLFEGQVKEVASTASTQDWLIADVKVYATTIALAGEPRGLRPGMSAEVRIVLGVRPNVLPIPLQAIVRSGANLSCFVKTPDGIVERRVVLGLTNDLVAEVREGLAEDEVVLRDPRALLARPELRPAPDEGVPRGARGVGRPATDILVRSVRPTADDEAARRRTRVLSYGLTLQDFERVAALPDVRQLVPVRTFPQEVRRLEGMVNGLVVATTADFAGQAGLVLDAGRFLTEDDNREVKNVAVLGAAVAARLFPLENPVGKTVRLGTFFYLVVGVLRESSQPAGGVTAEGLDLGVFLPLQTCQSRFGERITIRLRGSIQIEAVPLNAILVSVASPEKRTATADAIRALLEARHTQKDWVIQAFTDPS